MISKVPNQPANCNNVAPVYASDERIIFASDRMRDGLRHHYPQLDEYEEAPTVTGLWSLDPTNGDLFLMEHSPSGSFTPIVLHVMLLAVAPLTVRPEKSVEISDACARGAAKIRATVAPFADRLRWILIGAGEANRG